VLFISEAEYLDSYSWIYHKDYDTVASLTQVYGKSRLICFIKKGSGYSISKIPVPDDLEVIFLESKDTLVGGYIDLSMEILLNLTSTNSLTSLAALIIQRSPFLLEEIST